MPQQRIPETIVSYGGGKRGAFRKAQKWKKFLIKRDPTHREKKEEEEN